MMARVSVMCWSTVLVIVVVAASLVSGYRPYPDPGPDIPSWQLYCGHRSPGNRCCPNRIDSCTVPILTTLCYCDDFCDRTVSDCCPDFWSECRGLPPQPFNFSTTPRPPPHTNDCTHNGLDYHPGDKVTINCNDCTCVAEQYSQDWQCSQQTCLIRDDVIDHVNNGQFGWRASNHTPFWGLTLGEGIRYRLGTFRPVATVNKMTSLRVFAEDELPESFDARDEWPGFIEDVLDQGNCAASWAFSTTGVAADRIRIASSGKLRDTLSAQQLISCNHDDIQRGCEGGHIDRAWWYLRHYGVVSVECYPYTSGRTDETGECLLPRRPSTEASVDCPQPPPSTSRLYQATPPYRIAPTAREIMKELKDNGPLQATMEVKEDFYMYRSGVYRYSTPPQPVTSAAQPRTGYHSVRIIGWGVDHAVHPPAKYWLCVNSWGSGWGEDGYFRIARGTNESSIESFVVGAWGKFRGRPIVTRRHRRPRHLSRSLRHLLARHRRQLQLRTA